MKLKPWPILASTVILLSFLSFILVFQEEKTTPAMGSVPYIFWTSIVITTVIVIATFIGSIIFPYEDSTKV